MQAGRPMVPGEVALAVLEAIDGVRASDAIEVPVAGRYAVSVCPHHFAFPDERRCRASLVNDAPSKPGTKRG